MRGIVTKGIQRDPSSILHCRNQNTQKKELARRQNQTQIALDCAHDARCQLMPETIVCQRKGDDRSHQSQRQQTTDHFLFAHLLVQLVDD
jgi:hypothetical protein